MERALPPGKESLAWRQDRHEFHNRHRSQFVDVLALSLSRGRRAGNRAKTRPPRQLSGGSHKSRISEGHRPRGAPLRMEIGNSSRRSATCRLTDIVKAATSLSPMVTWSTDGGWRRKFSNESAR